MVNLHSIQSEALKIADEKSPIYMFEYLLELIDMYNIPIDISYKSDFCDCEFCKLHYTYTYNSILAKRFRTTHLIEFEKLNEYNNTIKYLKDNLISNGSVSVTHAMEQKKYIGRLASIHWLNCIIHKLNSKGT